MDDLDKVMDIKFQMEFQGIILVTFSFITIRSLYLCTDYIECPCVRPLSKVFMIEYAVLFDCLSNPM